MVRHTAVVGLLLCAVASAALLSASARREPVAARAPVVVELFTSEGCSSCPPADLLLQRLVDAQHGGMLIALGEHVDYWDHQGWKDPFSSSAFTRRQELYASRFNTESIYTPEMVVDGRAEFVGSDAAAAARAIDRAGASAHGTVEVAVRTLEHRADVAVSAAGLAANHERADIVLAVTEDHLSSDVKRGENHGRVLSHAAVVRVMTTIGEATGSDASGRGEIAINPAWKAADLKVVAFVQERRNRAILAAGVVPLVRP